jgi:hypothetical protein
LVNGDAETGDLTGWTRGQAVFFTVKAGGSFPIYSGAYSFAGGPAACPETSDMYQDVDVSDSGSCIDQSACAYQFSGEIRTDADDSARVVIKFIDAGNLDVGTYDSGFFESSGAWILMAPSGVIPAGTRRIRVHLFGRSKDCTSFIKAFFDVMTLYVVPATPTRPRSWGLVKATYR